MTPLDRLLTALLFPHRLVVAIWKRLGWGPFSVRLRYDAVQRPHYAYGIYWAAIQAKRLGLARISVIELGVAGGNGLILMERHAAAVERETGIVIEVYGFDLASGLPSIADYRDMPYFFRQGAYPMDRGALEARLKRAKLVIGDVAETSRSFVTDHDPAPIGFIAFDLDLYSGTRDAFALFSAPDDRVLPRVMCYFDDLIGPDLFLMNDHVGELLAIREFNARCEGQKISAIYGLDRKRIFPCAWSGQMFACHRFDHPLYNRFIAEEELTNSLALSDRP
jgi:hypothetical protein